MVVPHFKDWVCPSEVGVTLRQYQSCADLLRGLLCSLPRFKYEGHLDGFCDSAHHVLVVLWVTAEDREWRAEGSSINCVDVSDIHCGHWGGSVGSGFDQGTSTLGIYCL